MVRHNALALGELQVRLGHHFRQRLAGHLGRPPEDAASLYLQPGDVIEAEIERIGVLRNPVISWQEGHGTPPPERVRW